MSATERTIKQFIRDMNAAWLDGRIDELSCYFAENVVFVPPGDQDRLVGQAAIVESFQQYAEQVVTHAFEETSLIVDIMGSTAVARFSFKVRYEYGGSMYNEAGQDILVLAESGGDWQIVWRTQMTEASQEAA